METSVLIIAHNEEKHIANCIKSILDQTKKPDEIILLLHNSTDKTLEIAKKFPITIVPFTGKYGPVYARIEGINHVSGNIVFCLDGDSFAKKNWIEVMTNTLKRNGNVLVGSWIKFEGTISGNLFNIVSRYLCVSKKEEVAFWIWGGSFAFFGKNKDLVKKTWENSIVFSKKLNLSRNPDDYWLALYMSKYGNLKVTNKTWVKPYTKETSMKELLLRRKENKKNHYKIKNYFTNQII
ncbi:MAG: glycosyltransferase family 2 protein [Candidatus Paceibacterota bacterium]|jgi:glycosyltransferase involved in cell wall biosynthesis